MEDQKINLLGVVLSGICAVHCLAVPILYAFIGLSGHEENHLMFDIIMLSIAASVLLFSLFNELKNGISSLQLFIIGLGILFFILYFFIPAPFNHYFFAIGSLLWMFSHFSKLKKLS